MFERTRTKEAPFVDGDSDKGWKDTLIWCSLLDYAKDNEYEEWYFVTKDKGFWNDKNKSQLIDEFSSVISKKIVFINQSSVQGVFEDIGIVKPKKYNISTKLSVEKELEIHNAINDFSTYNHVYNNFGDYYQDKTFVIKSSYKDEDIINFCNDLEESFDIFTFMTEINLDSIFSKHFFLGSVRTVVDKRVVENFIRVWKEVKDKYPDKILAFVKMLESNFDYSDPNDKDSDILF